MSAPALIRSTDRIPAVGLRGSLRVLDGGASAPASPAAPVGAESADVRPAGAASSSARTARVPREVRLARTLMLGIVLVAVLIGVFAAAWSPSAAADDEGAAAGTVTVVVTEGESLWSVIGDRSYDRDPRAVIDEVHTLNGMESSVVHPGQRLILPAR